MMNWSQGVRELEACSQIAKVRRVLTTARLVQHMQQIHNEDSYSFELLYIEKLLENISVFNKLRTAVYASLPIRWLLKVCGVAHQKKTDTAVILFTSGTEKLPKAVPLTHANLQANQQACMQFFDPGITDVMLSFLPPFHAYGFNCCSLFPLLAGLPVVFSFNPLHAKKVVEMIEETQATLLGSTPLFFNYLLRAAKKQKTKLPSLRLIVIGGEVFKQTLYQQGQQYFSQVKFCQGYGTTECAPVITINTEHPDQELCVGIPIDGMKVQIVSESSYEPVPPGKVGLVLVRGTSLFPGYLGEDREKGFVTLHGERWYVTGDLGFLNDQGTLFLQGRLSRFVKIGGEMISLEALESILVEVFTSVRPGEDLQIVVTDLLEDKTKFCVFTTFETTVQEINRLLKDAQTSRLMRISYCHQLETIPMLGSGKPNYGALRVLAKQLFG